MSETFEDLQRTTSAAVARVSRASPPAEELPQPFRDLYRLVHAGSPEASPPPLVSQRRTRPRKVRQSPARRIARDRTPAIEMKALEVLVKRAPEVEDVEEALTGRSRTTGWALRVLGQPSGKLSLPVQKKTRSPTHHAAANTDGCQSDGCEEVAGSLAARGMRGPGRGSPTGR